MSKIQRQKKIFWTIITMSFIMSESLCFGTEQKTIAILDKQVIQLEEIWKAGKTNEYFLQARNIAKDIKAHSTTNNLSDIAARLFDNLISKEVNLGDAGLDGVGDLFAMDDLAWCLIPNDKASIETRRINTLLLCRYLGKIRKEIIPNFEPKRVVSNVAPPHGIPCAMAGMDPKVITNPVLRAQYEASIRENQENGLMNVRQQELRSMGDKVTSTRVIDCIIETFDAGDISSPFFIECINSAGLNDKEKEEVLKKVGAKQPKQESARGTNQNAR